MAQAQEKSSLKRGRPSRGEQSDTKKPRRSDRLSSYAEPVTAYKNSQLPSPVTHENTNSTEGFRGGTIEPPEGVPSQIHHHTPQPSSPISNGRSTPPDDTQLLSQMPRKNLVYEVEDEEGEGVWGYLLPLGEEAGEPLVLRRRAACPVPKANILSKTDGEEQVGKDKYTREEEKYEETKKDGLAASGYLIGRHPECDRVIHIPTVSNRHFLVFNENKGGDSIAVVEDLSGNGTFVNGKFVGRNKRRELEDGDEVAILDQHRYMFKYPRTRHTHGFRQQYDIQQQLGKGHFATVYLCVEKCSGMKYAVKKFEKRSGLGERSRVEGLQQEIAVLMGVSHPNVLCLKDTFDDPDGVYLVLELAVEGELFNWIVMKSKLTEPETRKVFIQLFQGVKYLHERNIVHRDIKPENILLVDKDLSVKLADFGLAKIIGEESFTTTLCGTPSYVAPEILESSNHRRYTRAVDVWSLGVVLYICLCGFPPFSDELYSSENPYNLSQQIKLGHFDYPSPYWDPVSDLALDLIDRMLTVKVEDRISIDQCLEHPWITQGGAEKEEQKQPQAGDSADSLAGAFNSLDFEKRKVHRERTLLSALNTIRLAREVPVEPENSHSQTIKVYEKNKGQVVRPQQVEVGPVTDKGMGPPPKHNTAAASAPKKKNEVGTAAERAPGEFMQMGGVGDQPLFGDDGKSRYAPEAVKVEAKKRAAGEGNGNGHAG